MQQYCEPQAVDKFAYPIAPSSMVTYQKAQLRVAEIPFDETCADNVNADLVRYKCRATPVHGSHCVKFYTLLLNLQDHPNHLLANMSHTTRYEIRRAQREGLRHEFISTPTTTHAERFFEFYDSFARSKNLKPLVARERILGLLSNGVLNLSCVSAPDERVLVWHAYLRSGRYACLLYSASLFRLETHSMATYISRANRFHHWSDILRFRDEGLAIYDFGGWYPGSRNQVLLRINRFKESFGGELVVQYDCDSAITWKGALGLWFARLMRFRNSN
jgi:hypothetical protein